MLPGDLLYKKTSNEIKSSWPIFNQIVNKSKQYTPRFLFLASFLRKLFILHVVYLVISVIITTTTCHHFKQPLYGISYSSSILSFYEHVYMCNLVKSIWCTTAFWEIFYIFEFFRQSWQQNLYIDKPFSPFAMLISSGRRF